MDQQSAFFVIMSVAVLVPVVVGMADPRYVGLRAACEAFKHEHMQGVWLDAACYVVMRHNSSDQTQAFVNCEMTVPRVMLGQEAFDDDSHYLSVFEARLAILTDPQISKMLYDRQNLMQMGDKAWVAGVFKSSAWWWSNRVSDQRPMTLPNTTYWKNHTHDSNKECLIWDSVTNDFLDYPCASSNNVKYAICEIRVDNCRKTPDCLCQYRKLHCKYLSLGEMLENACIAYEGEFEQQRVSVQWSNKTQSCYMFVAQQTTRQQANDFCLNALQWSNNEVKKIETEYMKFMVGRLAYTDWMHKSDIPQQIFDEQGIFTFNNATLLWVGGLQVNGTWYWGPDNRKLHPLPIPMATNTVNWHEVYNQTTGGLVSRDPKKGGGECMVWRSQLENYTWGDNHHMSNQDCGEHASVGGFVCEYVTDEISTSLCIGSHISYKCECIVDRLKHKCLTFAQQLKQTNDNSMIAFWLNDRCYAIFRKDMTQPQAHQLCTNQDGSLPERTDNPMLHQLTRMSQADQESIERRIAYLLDSETAQEIFDKQSVIPHDVKSNKVWVGGQYFLGQYEQVSPAINGSVSWNRYLSEPNRDGDCIFWHVNSPGKQSFADGPCNDSLPFTICEYIVNQCHDDCECDPLTMKCRLPTYYDELKTACQTIDGFDDDDRLISIRWMEETSTCYSFVHDTLNHEQAEAVCQWTNKLIMNLLTSQAQKDVISRLASAGWEDQIFPEQLFGIQQLFQYGPDTQVWVGGKRVGGQWHWGQETGPNGVFSPTHLYTGEDLPSIYECISDCDCDPATYKCKSATDRLKQKCLDIATPSDMVMVWANDRCYALFRRSLTQPNAHKLCTEDPGQLSRTFHNPMVHKVDTMLPDDRKMVVRRLAFLGNETLAENIIKNLGSHILIKRSSISNIWAGGRLFPDNKLKWYWGQEVQPNGNWMDLKSVNWDHHEPNGDGNCMYWDAKAKNSTHSQHTFFDSPCESAQPYTACEYAITDCDYKCDCDPVTLKCRSVGERRMLENICWPYDNDYTAVRWMKEQAACFMFYKATVSREEAIPHCKDSRILANLQMSTQEVEELANMSGRLILTPWKNMDGFADRLFGSQKLFSYDDMLLWVGGKKLRGEEDATFVWTWQPMSDGSVATMDMESVQWYTPWTRNATFQIGEFNIQEKLKKRWDTGECMVWRHKGPEDHAFAAASCNRNETVNGFVCVGDCHVTVNGVEHYCACDPYTMRCTTANDRLRLKCLEASGIAGRDHEVVWDGTQRRCYLFYKKSLTQPEAHKKCTLNLERESAKLRNPVTAMISTMIPYDKARVFGRLAYMDNIERARIAFSLQSLIPYSNRSEMWTGARLIDSAEIGEPPNWFFAEKFNLNLENAFNHSGHATKDWTPGYDGGRCAYWKALSVQNHSLHAADCEVVRPYGVLVMNCGSKCTTTSINRDGCDCDHRSEALTTCCTCNTILGDCVDSGFTKCGCSRTVLRPHYRKRTVLCVHSLPQELCACIHSWDKCDEHPLIFRKKIYNKIKSSTHRLLVLENWLLSGPLDYFSNYVAEALEKARAAAMEKTLDIVSNIS